MTADSAADHVSTGDPAARGTGTAPEPERTPWFTSSRPVPEAGPEEYPQGATLWDLLALERIEEDLFRAGFVFPDPYALYGGQVAAQALRAACHTVDADRLPHSLHGYYLRAGDASIPTVFQVFRDRDGRSYSARRVVAIQRGKVIFSMAASFHIVEEGLDVQDDPMPDVTPVSESHLDDLPRVFSFEGRMPRQPYPNLPLPSRFWARCLLSTEDPVLRACALTYLSDLSSGSGKLENDEWSSQSSLDHAIWFHRPHELGQWTLMELVPHTAAAGRSWYTGSMFEESGKLVASIAQETLFRRSRPETRAFRPHG